MAGKSRITIPNILNVFFITLSIMGLITLCPFTYSAAQIGVWFLADEKGCIGDESSTDIIEERGELSIPENAQNLKTQSNNSGDNCYIFIEFQMEADDLEHFLNSTHVVFLSPTQGGDLTDRTYLMNPDSEMKWSFEETETYLYGSANGEFGTSQIIIVDTTDSPIYKAYIIAIRFTS